MARISESKSDRPKIKRHIETPEQTAARDAAQRDYENGVLRQEAEIRDGLKISRNSLRDQTGER